MWQLVVYSDGHERDVHPFWKVQRQRQLHPLNDDDAMPGQLGMFLGKFLRHVVH